ncbi:energy transducer TonB [Chondromyces crocatus]|uniref:Biopolymer transporter TonB n=1 Tax=Chondromyces crocatus TaxID=52 RepID=A0A0K1ESL0_CHOCO|nr:energy transducer TonB [Chondromyces crocatus]AKT43627.1 biopolymer transporter TonB [Chondromyces crocatus]
MFDAVLNRSAVPQGRLGTGTLIALAAHGAAFALVFLLSHHAETTAPPEAPQVTLVMPPPPPPPPPPAGGIAKTTQPTKRPRPAVRPDRVTLPPERPQPTPPETPPPSDSADDDTYPEPGGQPGGIPGGTPGGTIGGHIGGVIGGTGTAPPARPAPPPPPPPATQERPFGQGMTRPVLLSGVPPTYTREARAARVEGMVLVQCVVTVDGAARNCRILKGLPHLEDAVLRAIATHRYKPSTFAGEPVTVRYTFSFRFKLE